MTGILDRWRQFGRRYFWPHLLLGMVAASLGLPAAHASEQSNLPEASSRSLTIGNVVRFDSLALLQESARRPNFTVDYWHQHAIRTVIRHLSFALTPTHLPSAEQALPLEVQKFALLDTLNALLTHESRPPVITRDSSHPGITSRTAHQTGLWLAQVQGIRAGPATLA
ncbi:secA translation cis-regulator SecM [Erwiniaceae bacterium BAC15a-03b]|uniref:Secretion monitor n=1 Tax=Winslowiella arboricola TaxID=2978220 RepID=A0A9J6PLF5_9GAMM|nr:secA translation cis-regulator SecM [Winslowiella arboricola]MCU5772668.1 secA translation cis-regulator SecM [Winslowiella arboricola]MCU5778218.1 secA translation cis-regulator SecM [Winslowiella arboricola]